MNALLAMIVTVSCATKNEPARLEKTAPPTEAASELFPKPKIKINTVGILLYDGFANLDAIGPFAVFSSLMGTKVYFVGRHKGLIQDARGMKVQVDSSIEDVRHLDILLIPGGFKETYELTKDEALLDWVRSIDQTSIYTTSVCTGAWILGATGLLKDQEATTHWSGKKLLAEDFGARITNTRYAHSGKYWTSAGVTAGMDMSLAILNEIAGENYTKMVMLDLEYDPQPPFEGGSVSNTESRLVEAVREMYDNGLDALRNPEKICTGFKCDNDTDFICKMPLPGNTNDTVHYAGKIYGFCSAFCRNEFKAAPHAYLN